MDEKIDEFKTHQIPPNLKFCLSPSKENKILFVLKQFIFDFFEDIFLFKAQLGRKHKLVVKLLLNMFPIIDPGRFSIKFTEPTNNSYGVNNLLIKS